MYSRYPFIRKLGGPESGLNLSESSLFFPVAILTPEQESERKYPKHISRLLQLHKRTSLTTTSCLITAVTKSLLRLYLMQSQLHHSVLST
jgi:hypothetical protein